MTADLFLLLLLIIIANGAPIIFRLLLGSRFCRSVDFGQKLPDGFPVFGPSKTWLGVISAMLVTPVFAFLVGYTLETGLLIGIYVVVGDLCSSFIKRRLRMKPSSMAPLLDQVPESLLPAVMMRDVFGLDLMAVFWLVMMFIIVELLLSHILYRWGIRNKPY